MRIEVERGLCGGMGICESMAPAYFKVGADGLATVSPDEIPSRDLGEVEDAVSSCPNSALRLVTA